MKIIFKKRLVLWVIVGLSAFAQFYIWEKLTGIYVEPLTLTAVICLNFFFFQRTLDKSLEKSMGKYKNLSVVRIMLQESGYQLYATITCCLFIYLAYISWALVLKYEINKMVFIALIGMVTFTYLRDKIFEFRIRKGMYGNNEREAREIISFILENSDDFENNGKGGRRRIIKKEDLEVLENKLQKGLVKGADCLGGGLHNG